MNPIKKSGWYHVTGEKLNHYFDRKTMISLCGKANFNSLKGIFLNLVTYHSILKGSFKCIDCFTIEQGFKVIGITLINPVQTYYTKSICPDCKADCVIISSKPTLKDIIHVHHGCPASD